MNRLKTYIFILIMSLGTGIFAQSMSQQQWSKMRDDAFLDFIQSGGTTEQWQHYSEQIVQEYLNRNYQTNKSGQQVLKQNYVNGTFLSGAGVEGYFYNNYVLNSAQQALGYFNNGYFLTASGQCVGYVSGSKIHTCDGTVIAYVNGDGFYNWQNYRLWRIQGETLYSNNRAEIRIVGLDMYSLAAFYLFIVN